MSATKVVYAGIDLGTTTSEIAYVQQGGEVKQFELLGEQGCILPSVVLFNTETQKPFVVGSRAWDSRKRHVPLFDSKRFLGRRPYGKVMDTIRSMGLPFPIVTDEHNNAVYRVVDDGPDGNYFDVAPGTVSGEILKTLGMTLRRKLKLGDETPFKAVITVPANFNEPQRSATKQCAKLANIEVLRLVAEPTAACVASLEPRRKKGENVDGTYLVFDFGGGTHDVSVVNVVGSKYLVKSTDGDTLLGGRDVDKILLDLVTKKLETDFGFSFKETDKDTKEAREKKLLCDRKFRQAITNMKIDLTESDTTELDASGVFGPLDWNDDAKNPQVSRAEFEGELKRNKLLDRLLTPVDTAMKAAGVTAANLKAVLLVGGSSRIPIVQDCLREKFGEIVDCTGSFDFAVSIGAAILAHSMDIDASGFVESKLELMDVIPASLGISCVGDVFSCILRKDKNLPISHTNEYVTVMDNQTAISCAVVQGEDTKASKNDLVDNFIISGLPALPKGQARIDVTFNLDAGGVLNVTVVDKSNTANTIARTMAVKRTEEISSVGGTMSIMTGQAGTAFTALTKEVYRTQFKAAEGDYLTRGRARQLLRNHGLLTFIHETPASTISLQDIEAKQTIMQNVVAELNAFAKLSQGEKQQLIRSGSAIGPKAFMARA